MTSKGPGNIDRREFIISAGLAIPAVGLAASPCPPPSVSVSGGSTAATACGPGQLPTLTLISAATSGTYAWTFGHVFKQGDIPSGSTITTDANSSQADIRNRWSDGSVKFAVLSGISAFSKDTPKVITLGKATAGTAPSTVPEPTTLDVTVVLTGGVTGTYTLQSCLGVDASTWNKANPGRVRRILGPVMSEFHYYRPTTDAHLAIWFYVRCYSNGATEVETVIENGWLNIASPGQRDYSATVSINGSSRFSGSVSHLHHARWMRVDWVGVDPQISPLHNVAYLRASKLVPNYGYSSPTATAFSGLASAINPAPFALGNWSATMANAGAQAAIGLLPLWEALFCATGDKRAYNATISNYRSTGRWSMHYRDETTGRVPLHASYPTLCLNSGWGAAPPAASGGDNHWDIPHHPSNGYLTYLLEGRWPALEALQFAADWSILDSNPDTRQGGGVLACINAPMTTRGVAWSWRSVGQAAAISPTSLGGGAPSSADAAVQASFAASVSNTARWHKQRYVDGSTYSGTFKNTIGWLGQYDRYSGGVEPATEFWGGSWMVQFQSLALGYISDLDIEGLQSATDLAAVRNLSYENCLSQLGDESTWNFRRGAVYSRPYLKNSSTTTAPVFMTTAEAFASYKNAYALSLLTANSGDTLKAHSNNADMNAGDTSNDGSGFWAVVLSVLSMAVEHGKAGAAAKRALVTAAPNYNPGAHGASDSPQWAIVPR